MDQTNTQVVVSAQTKERNVRSRLVAANVVRGFRVAWVILHRSGNVVEAAIGVFSLLVDRQAFFFHGATSVSCVVRNCQVHDSANVLGARVHFFEELRIVTIERNG